MNNTEADNILRLPEVRMKPGLGTTSIYNRIKEGRFPKPVNLGGRAVGWLESEVIRWQ